MKKNAYVVTVNYDRSIEDGIKAGKYAWTDSEITSNNFPSKEVGTKDVSIEFVHFGEEMRTDVILYELDKMGLRPATLKELLALGEKFPDLQREFSIIALGSVWDSDNFSHCQLLGGDASERVLFLTWINGRWWSDDYHFAAVRK